MDERAVIERAREGDERAWRWLHKEHHRYVLTLVRRIVGDPDRADDVAQEAWARVYAKLDLFRFRSSFRTWLAKVTTHVAYGVVRKKSIPEVDLPDTASASGPAPSRVVDRLWLQGGLDRLPIGYRTVVVLRQYGFADNEIAEILDVKPVTVRTQYRKALAHLYQSLVLSGGESSEGASPS